MVLLRGKRVAEGDWVVRELGNSSDGVCVGRGSPSLPGPWAQPSRAGPPCFTVSVALGGVTSSLAATGWLSVLLQALRCSNPDSGACTWACHHPGDVTPVPTRVAVWGGGRCVWLPDSSLAPKAAAAGLTAARLINRLTGPQINFGILCGIIQWQLGQMMLCNLHWNFHQRRASEPVPGLPRAPGDLGSSVGMSPSFVLLSAGVASSGDGHHRPGACASTPPSPPVFHSLPSRGEGRAGARGQEGRCNTPHAS